MTSPPPDAGPGAPECPGTFNYTVPRQADRTLAALLAGAAAADPDHEWLVIDGGQSVSYRLADEEATRIAHGLRERGVRRGDRVAVMCPNGWPLLSVWFAAAKLGAVFVPLNTHYRGAILKHALELCDPRVLVVARDRLAAVADCGAAVSPQVFAVTSAGTEAGGAVSASDFEVLRSASTGPLGVEVAASDPQMIILTSGTTGRSKGVLISNHQVYSYADIVGQACGLSAADTYLTCLPLFHVNAQLSVVSGLIFGNRVAVYPSFSASKFWDWVSQSRATVVSLFGSMAWILLKDRRWPRGGLPLRACWLFPATAAVADELTRHLGVATFTGYASTEANFVSIGRSADGRSMDSAGRVHPLFEARIIDPDTGGDAGAGQRGEIRVRARQRLLTMLEYYRMPAETAAAFDGDWFRTGDLGYFDAAGDLHFVDRLADSIRRNGENISSMEVEAVLAEHPEVAECAVLGVPGELAEQEVLAVVVPRDDGCPPDPAELARWAAARMAYFMVPKHWRFAASLPKTPNGKVRKAELRRLLVD